MSMKKISRRDFLKAAGIVAASGALTACGGSAASSSAAAGSGSAASAAGGKYKIALSNAFMGNDWRQIMIKCAEVAATKEYRRDTMFQSNTNIRYPPFACRVNQKFDIIRLKIIIPAIPEHFSYPGSLIFHRVQIILRPGF